jgi:hypothetical protein
MVSYDLSSGVKIIPSSSRGSISFSVELQTESEERLTFLLPVRY